MTKNMIKFLVVVLIMLSSIFVNASFGEKIKNFAKEKYGTTIMVGTLVVFAGHTMYNKYKKPKDELSENMKDALPVSIVFQLPYPPSASIMVAPILLTRVRH